MRDYLNYLNWGRKTHLNFGQHYSKARVLNWIKRKREDWTDALCAPPEDPGSILRTHMWLTTLYNSSPRRSETFFWPPVAVYTHGAQTYVQAKHRYTQNNVLNFFKELISALTTLLFLIVGIMWPATSNSCSPWLLHCNELYPYKLQTQTLLPVDCFLLGILSQQQVPNTVSLPRGLSICFIYSRNQVFDWFCMLSH